MVKHNVEYHLSLASAGIAQQVEQLTCNQQVVGSNPTHGSHWDCCVPNVDVLKWTSRSTSVVIIVVLFFM